MAVTQISQIQVRYGLQEDIGNLAGGEFAWAIDTQRLYIGNGTVEEGAPVSGITEIMTGSFDVSEILGNYTYQGVLGGYQVSTGIDANSDVVRSFQDKIDDFVNVRDYGVSATGNVDETAALQRAIDETYNRKAPITAQRTRRALRFNGGTYRIDGELKIPPYATFIGEGMDSVKIVLNGPAAKLTTTTGADAAVEINLGSYPYAVSFKNLTMHQTGDRDIIAIDGSNDIVFEDVAFTGVRVNPDTIGNGACVVIKSTARATSGIHFNRCTFKGLGYAAHIDSDVSVHDITFTNCRFTNLWGGVRTEASTGSLSAIKVSGSIFKDIYSNAVYGAAGVTGIVSTGNTYINCASGFDGDTAPVGIWQPIIVFQADGNHSVADIFARSLEMSKTYPRIQATGYSFVYISMDDCFRLGSARYHAGRVWTAEDGDTFRIDVGQFVKGKIDYTVGRNTDTRSGMISFSVNGDDVVWSDDYTETTDIGMSLGLSIDPTNNYMLVLDGVLTTTGNDAKLCYDIKTLD